MAIIGRTSKVADLEKTQIVDAAGQSENIGDEIIKVVKALKRELKLALLELDKLELARTKVVANNTKYLEELGKMPKSDEAKTIRDWAKE